MAGTYASYPLAGGSGGGVPTYATLAAFPSAVTAGNGALAIALDTDILYISNGTVWEVLANPSYAAAITSLTGDVTATGPGAAAASLVATTNATLVTLSALTTASALATVGIITSGTWSASTIAINRGGTGQVTAAAAYNALSPMTTTGDLTYEVSAGTAGRRAIGSTGNVLTVSGGVPTWAPPATSGTVTSVAMTVPTFLSVAGSPITSSGTLAVTLSGTALPILNGGTGQTTAAAAFNALSPMTTTGDLTYEVSANTAARLAIGSTGNVLTVVGGVPAWAPPATSGTVTSVAMTVPAFLSVAGSPVTSTGTLAVTLSGTALPVANGGTGQVTAAAAFNALSPITTTGDMIYSPSGATSQRLAVGSTGNVLTVSGGVPTWAPPATSGTVTSVAMTVPAFLSVAGSPVTSTGTLAVTVASGTSGGILGYTGTTTLASSALLAANQVVIGGGAGATPTTLAAGSQFQVLVMGASNPAYGLLSNSSIAAAAAIDGTKISPDFGTQAITTTASITSTSTTPGVGFMSALAMIIGTGDASIAAIGGTLRGAAKTGADAFGPDISIRAGNGTGNQGSGNIDFYTAPAAASSSTANVMQVNASILKTGQCNIGPSVATQASFSGHRIRGVSDGTSATAGMLGEYITSGAVTTAMGTTNAQTNVTSISLTAGMWDISGIIGYRATATTVVVTGALVGASISVTTNTFGGNENATADQIYSYSPATAVSSVNGATYGYIQIRTLRFSITSTTTVYLVGQNPYTGSTPNMIGSITARRVF